MSGLAGLGLRLLKGFDAETAHGIAISALKTGLVPVAVPPSDPALAVELFGLRFPNPVGLAAGFDKDAEVPREILRIGFGFTEVGTVTPLAQPGNPKPRMFRLSEDRAVINRLGFNNNGHAAALDRMGKVSGSGIIGVNVGANKDSEDKIADYVTGVRAFAAVASYITVNVSSPNTPGLRGLQDRDALEALLGALDDARSAADHAPPMLLKIAPDLDDDAIADIAGVVAAHQVDGVIISNTTTSRPALAAADRGETGGLSGAPLFDLATTVLARFYQVSGGGIPLIGVGGIGSGAQAWEKFRAGASLVQIYSGMVYEGPGLAADINRYLSERIKREGLAHITDVTGTGAEEWVRS
ncbi:MAG: quinone-dependent dihydroorotate dehydrogenase [Pseudomonadota bacterium]